MKTHSVPFLRYYRRSSVGRFLNINTCSYIDVHFAFSYTQGNICLNRLKAETKIDLIYLMSKYTQTLLREPSGGYMCMV